MCCTRLAGNAGRKKIAIWAPSRNFVRLYLHNYGTYRQSEKKLVKLQYHPHMPLQYGELRPTNSWDLLASLGHPCKFQQVSRLGSVTARQSSSKRQPNFAAMNRGRHLYSAGQPSRWALAHILVVCSSDWRLPRYPLFRSMAGIVPRFYPQTLASVGVSCRHVSVRPSVCLSQVSVLLKRLNIGSHRQCHTIAQDSSFLTPKISAKLR